MRLIDLLEGYPLGRIRDSVVDTLPPIAVIPQLDNGNLYMNYRFGTTLAAALSVAKGEHPYSKQVPWHTMQSVAPYSPQELEIVKLAAQQSGFTVDMLHDEDGREPDWVNTVSPVAHLPMLEAAGDDVFKQPKTPLIHNLSPADDKAISYQDTPTRGKPQIVVVYPGRFQPLHRGHKAVYDELVAEFGPNVYIATSNKTDPDKSPFDFEDKLRMARAAGIPADKIQLVKNPYDAAEIKERFVPDNTVLLFAVGEKDMDTDPRFKFDEKGQAYKKDGSLSYLQKWPGMHKAKTMDQHGYIIAAPTKEFAVLGEPATSATEIRKAYRAADPSKRDQIITDLYGKPKADIRSMFDLKLGHAVSEDQETYLQNPLDPEGDTNGPGKTGDQFNYDDDPVHLDDMNEGLTAQDIAIDPEEDRDRAELLKLVRQQQNLLPLRQRELIMRWAEGDKLADIAKDLGIDVKSAYQLLQKALKRIRGGLAVLHGHRIGPLYGYNNAYAGRTRPFVSDNLLQMIPFVQRDPNVKIVQVNYNQFTIAPRNDSRPEVIPDIELLQQKRKLAQDYNNAVRTANQIHAEQGNTNEYMNARAAATDLLKLGRQLAKKPKFSLQPSKASIEEVNVWDKPNPVKKHKHLSDKDKAAARARAKRAGRKWPNMVDNIWAARR